MIIFAINYDLASELLSEEANDLRWPLGIPEDAGLVNVDLKLNYLKSVTKGRLRAEGRSIREGKTICYSEARVYDDLGSLIVHGTSTLTVLPGKGLRVKSRKFLPA